MVNNLPEYINRVEAQISEKKLLGGTKFIQMSIQFESPNMFENFKRYWEKKSYKVWFKTCTRGLTDYEISWKNGD